MNSAFCLPEEAFEYHCPVRRDKGTLPAIAGSDWHQFMPLEYVHLLDADFMSGTIPLINSEHELI